MLNNLCIFNETEFPFWNTLKLLNCDPFRDLTLLQRTEDLPSLRSQLLQHNLSQESQNLNKQSFKA